MAHTDQINIGSMRRSSGFPITFYTNAQNITSTGMNSGNLKAMLTSNIDLWLGLFSQFIEAQTVYKTFNCYEKNYIIQSLSALINLIRQ